MNEKERARAWLDKQILCAIDNEFITDDGEEITNLVCGCIITGMPEMLISGAAELARILGEELIIEPFDGEVYDYKVYFMYKGVKIFNLTNTRG